MDINRIDHLGVRKRIFGKQAQTCFKMLDILLFPLFFSASCTCETRRSVYCDTLTLDHFFMPYPMPFIYSPFIRPSIQGLPKERTSPLRRSVPPSSPCPTPNKTLVHHWTFCRFRSTKRVCVCVCVCVCVFI
jgi:hypothetical protein